MSFSWWTQVLSHDEILPGPKDTCYQRLLNHYQGLGASIVDEVYPDSLVYIRGSVRHSLFGLGPENLCRHTVTVTLRNSSEGVNVEWLVDLKLCGFSIGENAILTEFKNLAANWE